MSSPPTTAPRGVEPPTSELHKDQIGRLFSLVQQVLAMEPSTASGERLLQVIGEVFRVRALCIFQAETAKLYTVGKSLSHLPECTLTAFIQKQDTDNPVRRVSVRLLHANGSITGAIG